MMTDRSARSAMWIRVAVIGLAVAFATQAAFGAWAVWAGAHARDGICDASATERGALRKVLIRAREAALEASTDPNRDARIRGFYAALLREVPPIKCDRGTPQPREEVAP